MSKPPKKAQTLAQIKAHKQIIEQRRHALSRGLPHLYGHKFYRWSRAFFESTNKFNFLIAGNQLGKSSIQIRKAIDWATNKKKWLTLWPNRTPRVFWYFYPSSALATSEFNDKWRPDFLPRDEFKRDPVYGWEEKFDDGHISELRFFSGITIYFKFYSQKISSLAASSVDAVFCDEEIPISHWGEIIFRIAATDGYFHMSFTNVLNQQFFHRVVEGRGEQELLPDAFKLNVSAWDCLLFEDGTPSHWTEERIKQLEVSCKSENEKKRRVFGRYVADDSVLRYPSFDPTKHYRKPVPIPQDWSIYGAVDPGSGGPRSHPAGILFLAVNPEKTLGYFFKAWRGDKIVTTAGDILEKFREMKRGLPPVTQQVYDFAAKDFGTLAHRLGEPFVHADKNKERGEDILSTLFKLGMLYIFDDDPELQKLGDEFLTLKRSTAKTAAADDLIDPARYLSLLVPWDWTLLQASEDATKPQVIEEKLTPEQKQLKERRERFYGKKKNPNDFIEEYNDEVSFWNELAGTGGD